VTPRAVVFGCAGPVLSETERRFFADADPLGFILFARNVHDPTQLAALVGALRDCVGREDAPVLVDQEGGRVQRLGPPHWRAAPPAARFGKAYAHDREAALEGVRLNARLLAADLIALGIDVDCAPVLDLPAAGAHDVIGDRAFGADVDTVVALGRAMIAGFLEGGVIPVIKHLPGHGRALADSHATLPVVEASRATLEATDFAPFRALHDAPWGMTAHVLYKDLDPRAPATLSPRVIGEIVRGAIGFDGVLLSDDISMGALAGSFADRTEGAIGAGCDVVLHCNGRMDEMAPIAAAAPLLTDPSLARLARARELKRRAPPVDSIQAVAGIDALCAAVS